jgi:hypothetical protein
MSDLLQKLNKALKPQDNSASASGTLRHENEAAILDAARKLLSKSEVGRTLLSYAQDSGVQMHVLRGADKFGYFPEKSTAYISCPAGQAIPNVRAVIQLAGALRQAMQEGTDELKSPQIRHGKERYLKAQIDRSADILVWQVQVVHETAQATGLLEIIDEFVEMGYGAVYEAYKADLEEAAS